MPNVLAGPRRVQGRSRGGGEQGSRKEEEKGAAESGEPLPLRGEGAGVAYDGFASPLFFSAGFLFSAGFPLPAGFSAAAPHGL